MNFEWSYSLKPPVAPFPVLSLKSFQNRVHRRLPLRQSFEVSGHLSMEVGIYELGWSVFIVFYRHSREYHLDLRLTVVSHDLKTSGLTSSMNSPVPRLPPIRRRWFVLLYEALPLVSRFWFCQGRLLQTKHLFDSSDLSPSRISLPSFNSRPDIPAHS